MIQLRPSLFSLALLAVLLSITTSAPAPAQTHGGRPHVSEVGAIDTECDAIQNAIMALKPVHVEYIQSHWKVLSEANFTMAQRTKKSVTFADVWKQGNNYAWVHSHTFDANGNQRATQLCFRQTDGTLARAEQANTVEFLRAASAKTAYFSPKGKVMQSTMGFEVNDPAIALKVTELPYYKVLP